MTLWVFYEIRWVWVILTLQMWTLICCIISVRGKLEAMKALVIINIVPNYCLYSLARSNYSQVYWCVYCGRTCEVCMCWYSDWTGMFFVIVAVEFLAWSCNKTDDVHTLSNTVSWQSVIKDMERAVQAVCIAANFHSSKSNKVSL